MMKSKYKPYPKYKPSGVTWIGEIPEGWEIRKLKWVILNGKSGMRIGPFGSALKLDIMVEDGVFVFGQENVISNNYSVGKRRITEEKFGEMKEYQLFPKDILISMMGSTGNFSEVPDNVSKGIFDSHLLRMRFRTEIDRKFFLYNSNYSSGMSAQIESSGKGSIMQGLNSAIVKQLLLPLPPLPEQKAIAAFLDRETGYLDSLVAKQTRMIQLLKEKRSALITHTVTKGLNPKVKMKDSGVSWLGEIPEGWEVRKLKNCIKGSFVNGIFKKSNFFGSGTKLVNVYDIFRDNFRIDYQTLERVITDKNEEKVYAAIDGDVFFVRSSLKEAGIAASACLVLPQEKTVFECHLIRVRPNCAIICPVYFIYQLNASSSRQRQVSLSQTVTMTTISQPKISILEIILPTLNEQKAIAEYLDRETASIDALVKKIERRIELLNEYRQSLITHAVTGKIDVREEVTL